MIDSIEINNFRCFHQTKISGFKSVNLIGGKNNSGKTALLEGIYLATYPSGNVIVDLQKQRGELKGEDIENLTENWKTLFFQSNNKEAISFIFEKGFKEIMIKFSEFSKFLEEIIIFNMEQHDDTDYNFYTLDLDSIRNKRIEHKYSYDFEEISKIIVLDKHDKKGKTNRKWEIIEKYSVLQNSYFIHSFFKSSDEELAKSYQLAEYSNQSQVILEAFKLIDDSIVEIRDFSFAGSKLYLKRENEKYIPLGMFGDAMSKIANIILKIINIKDSIVLIDEVENGIHYTNQEKFWEFLFKLSKAYNVQIFATSHSLEMISAFNRVAYQTEFDQDAMYFEMSRHAKSQEIIANPMDMEMLNYEILSKSSFRGE
jgi:AAA15 family ATPase/GTPase